MPTPALLIALGAPAAGAAAPTPAELAEVLGRFNAVAHFPVPTPSATQLQALAGGEVLRMVERRDDGNLRLVAMLASPIPKVNTWLATQDPHYGGEDDAIETNVRLGRHWGVWYALLDLPRPFEDRHWVIKSWDNVELAKSSGGAIWEHPWALKAAELPAVRQKVADGKVPGLTLATFDAAVLTPVNEGAMAMLDLPRGHSLFIYHATTDIGGAVPQRLVVEYVRSKAEQNLRRIEARARDDVPKHYRGAHPPVRGCDGADVPPMP